MTRANSGWNSAARGALTEALFLDVPYLIDSLFRWADFRGNRVGCVDLDDPGKRFKSQATLSRPFFWLSALVALFLMFGPTFESLCGPLGTHWFGALRILILIALYGWVVWLFATVLERLLTKLTRRLRDQAGTERDTASKVPAAGLKTSSWFIELHDRWLASSLLTGPSLKRFLLVLPDLLTLYANLDGHGRVRLRWNGLFIFAIAAVAVAPFAVAFSVIALGSPDPQTCRAVPGTFWPVAGQSLAWCAAVWASWLCFEQREWPAIARLTGLLAAWAAAVTVLWTFAMSSDAREMTPGPYPHLYPIAVLALGVIAALAWWLAHHLFADEPRVWERLYQDKHGAIERVNWAETFRSRTESKLLITDDRPDPPLEPFRVWAAVFNAVSHRPLQALLLPSLIALMVPTEYLLGATFWASVIGVLLLAYGTMSSRWEAMTIYIDRAFLIGTALPLSLLVIVLAVLRLVDVQYVATVLDAAPFGTIFVVLVMSYLAVWFFEHWINLWPAHHLLRVLGTPITGNDAVVPLPSSPSGSDDRPQASGRYLALHGTGRLCAHGWLERRTTTPWEPARVPMFTTYSLTEVFRALTEPGDDPDVLHGLRRRLYFYFVIVNLTVLLTAFGLFFLHQRYAAPLAVAAAIDVRLERTTEPPRNSLLKALEARGSDPAVIVAASGGGTRAALYTAFALEGLARIGHIDDIVLISGVSGGGVASAVFVDRFATLTVGTPGDPLGPWARYRQDMAAPFISDVLDGASELRIALATPLGTLLAESFTRRLFDDRPADMQDLDGPALILNTTITGHPAEASDLLPNRAALPKVTGDEDRDCLELSRPFASLSGSRLLFTTLTSSDGFPQRQSAFPDVRMDYLVVRADEARKVDPTGSHDPLVRAAALPLAEASALNANFPPVFSNARVRIRDASLGSCERRSYFVTDGGATENLGLVSALYALRGAIGRAGPETTLPPIHIVAIEASAVSYDYKSDRGIGAATGGSKERINGALTQELIESLQARLAERGKGETLQLHYLPLPVAFRSRGGLGTHWMYARTFRVSNPLIAAMPGPVGSFWSEWVHPRKPVKEIIDQDDVLVLWTALFDREARFCEKPLRPIAKQKSLQDEEIVYVEPTPAADQVRDWICGVDTDGKKVARNDLHVDEWATLVRQLELARSSTATGR